MSIQYFEFAPVPSVKSKNLRCLPLREVGVYHLRVVRGGFADPTGHRRGLVRVEIPSQALNVHITESKKLTLFNIMFDTILFVIVILVCIFNLKIRGRCALLLCTYNEQTRREMYHNVIRWWMNNSDFDIYIIDSSNEKMDDDIEKQCSVHHFNQVDFGVDGNTTDTELFSLQQAYSAFWTQWVRNGYDYVVKLTCKYKLLGLEHALYQLNDSSNDIICQSRKRNCELIGFKASIFKELINELKDETSTKMEAKLIKVRNNRKYIHLLPLKNIARYKRANGSILGTL